MKFKKLLVALVLLITANSLQAQSVVVNKYYNGTPDVVELLVIQDNLDMRGFIVKDFSSSNASDGGGKYQFTTDALWSSLRAGTLIILRNNNTAADVTTSCTDFVLDLGLQNTTYFTLTAGTMDIATNDMVMIKTGSNLLVANNIHVLRGGSAGTQWTNTVDGTKIGTTSTVSAGNYATVNNASEVIGDFNLLTTGVTVGTGYTWGSGNTANNTNFINFLRGPVSAGGSAIGAADFTANWAALTGAASYILDVSTASDFSSFVSGYSALNVGSVTSYAVSGLSPLTTYYYRVRALNVTPTTSGNSCSQSVTTIAGGFVTAANGPWNTTTTWVGSIVPSSSDNVTILHAVTNTTGGTNITRNAGTTTVVNAGASLATGAFTFTNNGTTTINGTFTIQSGGYAAGTDFVYGGASTLVMNHNTGAFYDISAGQAFWPVVSPPFNVTISANSPTRLNEAVGAVGGILTLNNGIEIAVANALTVNGTLLMNLNSFINNNSPIYGSASLLSYRTTATYGRGYEWLALGVGTIGTTPGYPNNVRIGNNTTLNYNNGTPLAKACLGTFTIDVGSTFDMANGTPASTGTLTIGGSVSNAGTFTFPNVDSDVVVTGNFVSTGTVNLGTVAGADLHLNGNATISGTFNGNNRAVFFTNNAATQVVSTSLNPLTIPYVVFAPTSGSTRVQLTGTGTFAISAPLGGNAVSFNNAGDVFDLNNETLTIGTTGVANVISGSGFFEGSTTSYLTLLGTGSIGVLRFVTDLNLATLTINRTSGAVGCVMGSNLNLNQAISLDLTAGILDLDSFTVTAEGVINNASSSNYVIADNAFGGIFRRRITTKSIDYVFPVGDKTGTLEYSPATVNFNAASGTFSTAYFGVSVNDSKHPDITTSAPTHFISRYWVVSRVGTFNTPNYNFTGDYVAADINGTENTSLAQQWDGSTWLIAGASPLSVNKAIYSTSTYLPLAGTNHFTGCYRVADMNIKQGVTNYLTGSTYTFANTTAGSFVDVVFNIENLGNQNLLLYNNSFTGNPPYSLTTAMGYTATVVNGTPKTFTIRFAPVATGTFTGSITFLSNDPDEASYVLNFTGIGTGTAESDIINVAATESATIASTVNGAITVVTDGVQVWNFKVRDGGSDLVDADVLPTVLTDLILTQSAGNAVGTWSDGIQSIALFDGATLVGTGTVTATQIQFSGMSVSVTDGTEKTLSMRLTLKCPLGADAIDGEDFGFSIVNSAANIIFSVTGSGRLTTAYTRSSTNATNIIAVTATKLLFTTQPITTGVNTAMTNVVVTATDNCGSKDINFTGSVVITSTGTMTGTPITVAAVAGAATFVGITHTVIGTDFSLGATATGLTGVGSTLFDIATVTVLNPGDFAVLAVNTNTEIATGTDLISFVCFRDLLPGTTLFITDNGYERKFAGLWGGTEGVIELTRTGSTLPKGTIVTIETTTANVTLGTHYDVYTCGAIDANWAKSAIGGSGFNLNTDDDVWFMQGGVWTNDTGHSSTYTGNVLYGWTESGWNTAPGGASEDTKWSTLFPLMECFSTIAPTGNGFVKYDDPIDPDFTTLTNGKFDWIASINNQANWDSYADNTTFTAGGYDYKGSCALVFIDTDIYVNGKWSGRKDTNWFNCENWDTLVVPDATVDVLVADTTYDRRAVVDATAPFAIYLNYIAKAKNLTITGEGVEVSGNIANKLEVHGNLTIANTVVDGALDMNEGNPLNADGQIYLYGYWTNNKNNTAFDEGNGTVHFVGSPTPQVINNVTPLGTEIFYNVLMDNNFNTSVSNDLVASGDLTLSATRTLTAAVGDYIRVNNILTNNGDILIEDDAQLIQVNDVVTNAGDYTSTATKFQVRRAFTAKHIDYVYWSAPIENYNVTGLPSGYRYIWNPTYVNTNGTMGNWNAASGLMAKGKGYIARTFNGSATPITATHTFRQGKPNNGVFTFQIRRGSYNGPDYDADPVNLYNVNTTKYDDNWNLVGNPYPSAIDAIEFLDLNTNISTPSLNKIEYAIWIWRHGLGLSNTTNPFYNNFGYSYSPDYLMFNSMGSTEPSFDGKIASGQGFMINMTETAGSLISSAPDVYATDITFNNSLRLAALDAVYDNTTFFRTANLEVNPNAGNPVEEKSRIWLDIVNTTDGQVDTTLLGYSTNSTLEYDRPYDCFFAPRGKVSLYSLIDQKQFIIQGRPLPFNTNDRVPMGVNIVTNGNHTIAIKKIDGIFVDDINIYIEDLALNVIHDLKQAPYSFNADKGMIDNRFIIRYTNNALGNEEFETLANTVIVSGSNGIVTVTSQRENIKDIVVYDVLGRELVNAKAVNNLNFSRGNVTQSSQALIVKVTLENGAIVTKKIIL